MKKFLVGAVKGYKLLLSPVLPPSCIYYPTCSSYTIEALEKHGALNGLWLSFRRLLRCHPFKTGGIDPVP